MAIIKPDGGIVVDGNEVDFADLQSLVDGGDPGVTPGTVAASKTVIVDAHKHIDTIGIDAGGLKIGTSGSETAVTATGAELNVLHGVTAGTAKASSAVVLDDNKAVDAVRTASLNLGASGSEVAVTATGTELNVLAGATAGTVVASKALVVDSNMALNVVRTESLRLGASGSEVAVTSTADELNELHGAPFTISQVSTPATGSNGTQFTFKDAAGVAVATPVSGMFYVSKDSTGLTVDAADTGVAVLTNGAVEAVIAAKLYHFVTTAAGLMGLTITATAGSWYIAFILPNGKVLCSTVLTIN